MMQFLCVRFSALLPPSLSLLRPFLSYSWWSRSWTMAIVSRLGKVGGWGRKPGLSVARLSRSVHFDSCNKAKTASNLHLLVSRWLDGLLESRAV
ncbi:hypothetical protein ASPTUDRAFT_771553 [Aspergillus tubingensis CBS 134.48]|uniref:Secreted protein n=1 Tax=Aspergillus tubingensis (strain CBS 134.48) TaxID=767770 RepID=A0A1L9MZ40_ASPTC|nr:hypothetical protein ASPTUDRAFT_771553 [Aspergillus tubingensis CBS 134.48]